MGMKSFFASEMRRVREEKGLSIRDLAEIIGTYKEASLRVYENGYRTPTIALAIGLDKAFGTPGTFVALQREAELDGTPFGDLEESEQRASSIRMWDSGVIPGLLQNAEYAGVILRDQELLDGRIERQKIFTRDEPPMVRAIICESLLYQEIGGLGVLRRQLEYLIRDDAHWTIQVMPQSVGVHDGLSGPFMLLEFPDGEPPVAFLDSRNGGTIVDDQDQVAAHWRDWECMTSDALSPALSREMIEAVIADLPEE